MAAPIAKPTRRPETRISIAANTVASAVPTTMIDIGSVASDARRQFGADQPADRHDQHRSAHGDQLTQQQNREIPIPHGTFRQAGTEARFAPNPVRRESVAALTPRAVCFGPCLISHPH